MRFIKYIDEINIQEEEKGRLGRISSLYQNGINTPLGFIIEKDNLLEAMKNKKVLELLKEEILEVVLKMEEDRKKILKGIHSCFLLKMESNGILLKNIGLNYENLKDYESIFEEKRIAEKNIKKFGTSIKNFFLETELKKEKFLQFEIYEQVIALVERLLEKKQEKIETITFFEVVIETDSKNQYKKNIQTRGIINNKSETIIDVDSNSKIPIKSIRYDFLKKICEKFEKIFKEVNILKVIEQNGKLYVLDRKKVELEDQDRVVILKEMFVEGKITKKEVMNNLKNNLPKSVFNYSLEMKEREKKGNYLFSGEGFIKGIATGSLVLDSEKLEYYHNSGRNLILLKKNIDSDDYYGLKFCEGYITIDDSEKYENNIEMLKYINKPLIISAKGLKIDEEAGYIQIRNRKIKELEKITINSDTGEVFLGNWKNRKRKENILKEFMSWAEEEQEIDVIPRIRRIDELEEVRIINRKEYELKEFEKNMFDPESLDYLIDYLCSKNLFEKKDFLKKIEKSIKPHLEKVLEKSDGMKVHIRFFQNPVSEFLPEYDEVDKIISKNIKQHEIPKVRRYKKLRKKIKSFKERNPDFGVRGIKAGIIYDDLNRLIIETIRSILEKRRDIKVKVSIYYSNINFESEISYIEDLSDFKVRKGYSQINFGVIYDNLSSFNIKISEDWEKIVDFDKLLESYTGLSSESFKKEIFDKFYKTNLISREFYKKNIQELVKKINESKVKRENVSIFCGGLKKKEIDGMTDLKEFSRFFCEKEECFFWKI